MNRPRRHRNSLADVETGSHWPIQDKLEGRPEAVQAASGVEAVRPLSRPLCGT